MADNKLPVVRISTTLSQGYGLEIMKYTAALTVATAQKGEQLSKLRREDEDQAIRLVSHALNNLNSSINIGNKMSADQIIETSLCILNEYWFLKIDEVLNCFKMVKGGKFGKIYGLDQPTVMGFIVKYDTEIKAGFYKDNEPVNKIRVRSEEGQPKHVALSVEEMKALENRK